MHECKYTTCICSVDARSGWSQGCAVPRFFNTSGPNNPEDHYTLPVMTRLPGVRGLVDQKLYFVLHAPRQVGKTTTLLTLAHELTAEGRYAAVLLLMEQGAPFSDDPGAAELAVLSSWRQLASAWLPNDLQPPRWPDAPPGSRIATALKAWAEASPRPLVVFLDEIDALHDDALISVLRQIRANFTTRPQHFPWSLALIGLRDVRDYKVASGSDGRLGTSSPFNRRSGPDGPEGRTRSVPFREAGRYGFNIKAESLTLRNFTRDEVAELYAQHTTETGQAFEPEAVEHAFGLTNGQPWLVNALARQLTQVLVPDPTAAITAADVEEAKELLIRRQDTHLDSLMDRLREPRVRVILEPMLAGTTPGVISEDDRRFALDLGLLRRSPLGGLEVANPIYREIIVRTLASGPSDSLPKIPTTWLTPDGQLDEDALLRSFLDFWRQHGEPLLATAPYHEIAPHLVLMAFLHRVVNGGSIEREYAIGSGRMDLCLRYAGTTVAIEIKVWRPGAVDPLAQGLVQLDGYLAGLGLDHGWLVIFDRRPDAPPLTERLGATQSTTVSNRRVVVVRA
jgi:hypothetical protein